jgi:hypothetical protein
MAITGEQQHRGVKAVDVVGHFHSSVRILVMPPFEPLSGSIRFLSGYVLQPPISEKTVTFLLKLSDTCAHFL